MAGEKEEKVVEQLIMFTGMFIERFESYFGYKRDISLGRFKPSRSGIVKTTERLLNNLCFNFPIPVGTVASSAYISYLKKKIKKSTNLFPTKITRIETQLTEFAFEVFRCYESVLANVDYEGQSNENVAVNNKYNTFSDVMIDKIFVYFESNASKIRMDERSSYVEHFMKAFFKPSSNELFPSEMLHTICNVGIVIIDDRTKEKRYFKQKDFTGITEHYRILNHKEMKKFNDCRETDVEKKLFKVLGDEYVSESRAVKNSCVHLLSGYNFKNFKLTFGDNTSSDYSFQTFGLPDCTSHYIQRELPVSEINKHIRGNITVVVGLKGCGKRELAINVGHEMSKTNNVFYIDASDVQKSFECIFEEAFDRKVDQNDGIENIVNDVYKKYKKAPNFLIFDNANSITSIEKYLPKEKKNWKILITSTSRDWHRCKIINLNVMNEAEAVELFKKRMLCFMEQSDFEVCWDDLSNSERFVSEVKKLLASIPTYPLVIRQSAAYIFNKFRCKSNISSNSSCQDIMYGEITSFVDSYKHKLEELLKFDFNGSEDIEYGRSIFATTLLMIDKLKAERDSSQDDYKKNVISIALDILNVMTYFEAKDIPMSIFKSHCYDKCTSDAKDDFFSDVVDLLINNLFIKRSDHFKNIEELVQIVNKVRLKEEYQNTEEYEKILVTALKCLRLYVIESDLNEDATGEAGDAKDKDLQNKLEKLNTVLKHISAVWKYACKYPNICKEFIIERGNNELPHTTFFHIIVQHCDLSVVRNIVDSVKEQYGITLGRMYQKENYYHKTPLHCAAESGNLEMVRYLIELFPNIDLIATINNRITKRKQWTPLHLATKGGYKDIVDYLLERGHRIMAYSNFGFTPLHIAAANGFGDILTRLVQADNVNDRTNYDFTPLNLASQKGHLNCVNLLLENNADYKAVTQYQRTALHFAADCGNDDIVDVLLSRCDVEFVRLKDKEGFTALHWAAFSDNANIVEKLLNKDASVIDEVTTQGNTALHLAVKEENVDVIKILIEHKARDDIMNQNDELAVDLARSEEVKKALKRENASKLTFIKNVFG